MYLKASSIYPILEFSVHTILCQTGGSVVVWESSQQCSNKVNNNKLLLYCYLIFSRCFQSSSIHKSYLSSFDLSVLVSIGIVLILLQFTNHLLPDI